MFDQRRFPYIIARNRFKVELVDVRDMQIHTLGTEMNTSNMHSKLQVDCQLDREVGGQKLQIFYNAQLSDKRALRCLEIGAEFVQNLYKSH